MASNGEKENEVFTDSSPPGQYPTVDDQGYSSYCTSYAVAKAICNFFQKKGRDLKQETIATCLYNKHNGNTGKWPEHLTGETFRARDKNGNFGTIKLDIKKATYSYGKDHVLVYESHTMYLMMEYTAKHGVNKNQDIFLCMNSWGPDKEPFRKIPVNSKPIVYEVHATWTDEPLLCKKKENNGAEEQKMEIDETEIINCEMGPSQFRSRKRTNGHSRDSEDLSRKGTNDSNGHSRDSEDGLKFPSGDTNPQSSGTEKSFAKTTSKKNNAPADGLKRPNGDNTISQSSGIPKKRKRNDEPAGDIAGYVDGVSKHSEGSSFWFSILREKTSCSVICFDINQYAQILAKQESNEGVLFKQLLKKDDNEFEYTGSTTCKRCNVSFLKSLQITNVETAMTEMEVNTRVNVEGILYNIWDVPDVKKCGSTLKLKKAILQDASGHARISIFGDLMVYGDLKIEENVPYTISHVNIGLYKNKRIFNTQVGTKIKIKDYLPNLCVIVAKRDKTLGIQERSGVITSFDILCDADGETNGRNEDKDEDLEMKLDIEKTIWLLKCKYSVLKNLLGEQTSDYRIKLTGKKVLVCFDNADREVVKVGYSSC